jgi:hypothetical protein
VRTLRWVSGLAWVGSWWIILMEIFRWHHMDTRLRFTPPEPPAGVHAEPHAGLPVIAACGCACLAPVVFLAATAAGYARRPR